MIKGNSIILRPALASDLDRLYAYHIDIANRGSYMPHGVLSHSAFQKRFQENGFWDQDEGVLLIVSLDGVILGQVEFFRTVNYLDEIELAYHIYDPDRRGKGLATEAVLLFVNYLFENKRFNRIRLVIHPDNAASRRVAEKCGFLHEGTARGAWFSQGRHQDVEIYAILRDEHRRKFI